MDIYSLLILLLLVIILFKLSDVQSRLEIIEKLFNLKEPLKEGASKPIVRSELKKDNLKEKANISEQLAMAKKNKPKVIKEVILTKPVVAKPKQTTMKEHFEKRFTETSLEELLFGNIILKIAIVAFILGIGLFLKYSIDKDWIPIWGRVLIGIVVGMTMLFAGIKMIKNRHKLFSEGLFGGGIAVLYLSIFASFALEGFKIINVNYAFVAMIFITTLAGIISIRFNAKSTAIFGLIGGFATPFLLSTGSGNYVGLLTYMLMLNLGVLYISLYKKWSLLSWLAFIITSLSALVTVWYTKNDFMALTLLYSAFFIIYSIVPFINQIRKKEKILTASFVWLFWANFMVAIFSFLSLFEHYNVELLYYALVTVVLAGYLLLYATILVKRNIGLKNLFYIVLSQSIVLLLITPAFIFDGASLTIVWAVESLMLLWVSIKSNEKTYGLFALLGFIITVGRYLLFDVLKEYESLFFVYGNTVNTLGYVQGLAVVSFFVIGSLFMAYRVLKKAKVDFVYLPKEFIQTVLFFVSFVATYLLLTFMTLLLSSVYFVNLFSMVAMFIIGLFSFLLIKSDYSKSGKSIFIVFLTLLSLFFIHNIMSISSVNTTLSLINFVVFMAVSGFIYLLAFKESTLKVSTYQLSEVLLAGSIGLLFIFLNVEVYHVVKLYSPNATKFALTLLWVVFGISLFVSGVIKKIKLAKVLGTILIFVAILKAFFVDLAKLDSIYRIVLFLILGVILFGLSYFYQKNNHIEEGKE